MRITVNLATRPFADLGPAIKQLRIGMGVLLVVAGGLWLGLHELHQAAEDARARDHSLDGKIAAVNLERQGYQEMMRKPANAELLVQAATLNQLFDRKAFSWTLAMEDLETVLPGGVQASNLEPIRDKEGRITLHLRVVGPRDRAVELVQNLEHSKYFLLPRIVGESAESTGGPGERLEPVSASNRINLDLLAEYNTIAADAPRPERKAQSKPAPEPANPPAPVAPARAAPPAARPLAPVAAPVPLVRPGQPGNPNGGHWGDHQAGSRPSGDRQNGIPGNLPWANRPGGPRQPGQPANANPGGPR